MRQILTGTVLLLSLAACGEGAEKKPATETEIIDTGNIQDGTEVDKTMDIDTPEVNKN